MISLSATNENGFKEVQTHLSPLLTFLAGAEDANLYETELISVRFFMIIRV